MILYFSATGNCAFAAKRIAERTGDEAVNLLEKFRANDHSALHSEKPWVVVSPVYVAEMPRLLAVPGFDVLDYGQECNVFGNSEKDARHWNERLLEVFQDNELALSSLFGA